MNYQEIKIPNVNFAEYLENLSFAEVASIRSVDSFTKAMDDYLDQGRGITGVTLPWSNTYEQTRLSKGELSIWAGPSGSGKSLLLGQVMTGAMNQDEKVLIASLEMSPQETLSRMINQSATCKASREYSNSWIKHFTGSLWVYDELDRVQTKRILGMAHWAANELGITHIVIDSLTKCGVGRDDYTEQAKFVDRLQWCAKTWNINIHLVCHMRKSERVGKNDIRGAAEITDLADNVYIITRNKTKEEQVSAQLANRPYKQEILDQADCYLEVAKNRKYGEEPTFGLYYNKISGNYANSKFNQSKALDVTEY